MNAITVEVGLFESETGKSMVLQLPCVILREFVCTYFEGHEPKIEYLKWNDKKMYTLSYPCKVNEINDLLNQLNSMVRKDERAYLAILGCIDFSYNIVELVLKVDKEARLGLNNYYFAKDYEELAVQLIKSEFKKGENLESYECYIDFSSYADDLDQGKQFLTITDGDKEVIGYHELV